MALAHMLLRYGRRVCPKGGIHLLHVNHGWRGKESDADEALVRKFAKQWKVPLRVYRVKNKTQESSESWEDLARKQRKVIFQKAIGKKGGWIFTAHHGDDLAETVLWRICTGGAGTHGGGILVRHGIEVRPFLRVRKRDLELFLREEGVQYRVDRTNFEGRFLRSKMRLKVLPVLEKVFPRAVEHLMALAFQAQAPSRVSQSQAEVDQTSALRHLFSSAGVTMRREHWEALETGPANPREVHLRGGWSLKRTQAHRQVQWTLSKCDDRMRRNADKQ